MTILANNKRSYFAGGVCIEFSLTRRISRSLRLTGAMIPTELYSSTLTPHPETQCNAELVIEVRVCWTDPRMLSLTYLLKGDNARIKVPPQRTPRRADRLWEHSCFEAFVGELGKPEYCEFNFSPSREWAAYRFRDYRDGGPMDDDGLEPKIAVRREAETLAIDAVMRLDRLLTIAQGARLRLGLSAVLEDTDGRLSYWALKHPPGKPDFHHPDGFMLEIQPPLAGVEPLAYTSKP